MGVSGVGWYGVRGRLSYPSDEKQTKGEKIIKGDLVAGQETDSLMTFD